MPSVSAFERSLEDLGDLEREDLLRRAALVRDHVFDLLGSGPIQLGDPIEWRRDFKSGRAWPADHISRIFVSYPDDSDIKVPWELARCQHLPLLAAAWRLTGDRAWLDELGAQISSFIEDNPVELGPNWQCTMDVAIRAANWCAALALAAEGARGETWLERAIASLLLHGRFIRAHPEWGPVRGNHYLSDIVGLLPVAALFSGGREGRSWARWATRELSSEMRHQVRADGTDHEASIPYHRLVTELFVCGTQAADAVCPRVLDEAHRERLARMLAFVADVARPDGLSPQVGDADSSRYMPLGDYASLDFRHHGHLAEQAGPRLMSWAHELASDGGHAAYPEGGYWVMRHGALYCLVRCGDVGLEGRGCHAHNDQLSFELCTGPDPLVVDPGTYLYTASPDERNRFRSVALHATLQLDDEEPNPLRSDQLFVMEDRAEPELLAWESNEDGTARFAGRHSGFTHLPGGPVVERELRFDGPVGRIEILDTVRSMESHEVRWAFPLDPAARVRLDYGTALVERGAAVLRVECLDAELSVEQGWYSPAYGVREPAPRIVARRTLVPDGRMTRFMLSL